MHRNIKDMDRLCKIRDIQRAVTQFEQGFEKTYGICLNEGMALCSLLKAGSLSSGDREYHVSQGASDVFFVNPEGKGIDFVPQMRTD